MYAMYLEHGGDARRRGLQRARGARSSVQPPARLVVMDLSLPGIDGWEATRRLKADERTKKIPVLALTSHALEGYSEGARAAGCDGVRDEALPARAALERNSQSPGRFLGRRGTPWRSRKPEARRGG